MKLLECCSQMQTTPSMNLTEFIGSMVHLIVENILQDVEKTPEEADAFREYVFTGENTVISETDIVRKLV